MDFKLDWNVPCIIHYTRRDFVPLHDLTGESKNFPCALFTVGAEILFHYISIFKKNILISRHFI